MNLIKSIAGKIEIYSNDDISERNESLISVNQYGYLALPIFYYEKQAEDEMDSINIWRKETVCLTTSYSLILKEDAYGMVLPAIDKILDNENLQGLVIAPMLLRYPYPLDSGYKLPINLVISNMSNVTKSIKIWNQIAMLHLFY